MPDRDELDLLIDSAVSSYGDTERGSGFEARILARIAAEETTAKKRRWLPWAIALPIAAGLLLLLMLPGHKLTEPPFAGNRQIPAAHGTEVAKVGGETLATPHPARRLNEGERSGQMHTPSTASSKNVAPLPRLDVFPTPQPLSPEEEALVAFAAKTPEAERKAFLEAQQHADAPISISAIQIQPLDPSGNGGN